MSFTDTFDGADNTLVAGRTGWTATSGYDDVIRLNGSGAVKTSTFGGDGKGVITNTGASDHYVEFVVGAGFALVPGNGFLVGVCATGRSDFVALSYDTGSGFVRVRRGGSNVEGLPGIGAAAGDVFRLEWNSTAKQVVVKKNGSTIYTSGAGIFNTIVNTTNAGMFLSFSGYTGVDDIIRTWNSGDSAADTTAPILTSAVGTATGSTTATVGATTDEANGTMYVVVTTSNTQPSIAQIKAGQNHTGAAAAYASSQAISTTGAKTFSATGLTSSTTYYAHLVHTDSAANDSNRITSASFTTDTVDTTAPTLTSGVGTVESNALIVVGATTDEANGTMYVVLTTSSTPPSATQVRNGQDHTGAAAVFAGNQAIGSTGAKTFNATGLTQLTAYYPYIVHRDAAGNDSSVLSIGSRTTFRDGATGQAVIDNTGSVGGNPEGIMYNDVVLPGDADKWFSYRIVSGPTTPADFTFNADGSFSYSGTTGDSFNYQLEVDGVDTGAPQTVSVDPIDGTAPILTSPTATATGATTADGSVSTDEANGTLYWLATANASESAATVKAGSSQAVSTTGVQNVNVTGLTAATSYYLHFVHRDSSGNDSTVATSAQFTTDAAGDTTAPTLTSPTATPVGSTAAFGEVTTDEGNGTLYYVATANATETAAYVIANGASKPVTATGLQTATFTGLLAETSYYGHFVQVDAALNESSRVSTAQFTTGAVVSGGLIPSSSQVVQKIAQPIARRIARPLTT